MKGDCMPHADTPPVLDPELAAVMASLVEQARREPISSQLRELVQRLETALAAAHSPPDDGG